jgi:hypothetical protein
MQFGARAHMLLDHGPMTSRRLHGSMPYDGPYNIRIPILEQCGTTARFALMAPVQLGGQTTRTEISRSKLDASLWVTWRYKGRRYLGRGPCYSVSLFGRTAAARVPHLCARVLQIHGVLFLFFTSWCTGQRPLPAHSMSILRKPDTDQDRIHW